MSSVEANWSGSNVDNPIPVRTDLSTYVCGPQGAAVPLTREQQLEQALVRIYSEARWAEKRRLSAHQRAMQRIRDLVEASPVGQEQQQ